MGATQGKPKTAPVVVNIGSEHSRQGKATKKVFTSNEVELMTLLLPVWYTTDKISSDDVKDTKESWNLILQDTSEEFRKFKGTPDFKYQSCVVWFFDTFYNRFFDVHPHVRPLFKNGLVTQGRFLVKMISLIVSELEYDADFNANLYRLAVSHNAKGIKASEYGLVGEILFFSLRKCIGPAYTVSVSRAWIKVFSRMLSVLVPKAIALELATDGDNQERRLSQYEEEEKSIEVRETQRKNDLLELAKTNQCPFSHESIKDARTFEKLAADVTRNDIYDVPNIVT